MKLLRETLHMWRRDPSDQPVIVTFWPQDFHIGAEYPVLDHWYRITRYVPSVDSHFYEVWGQPVSCPKDAADLLIEISPRQHPRAA